MTNIPINAEILRELLHYEPSIGIFTWRRRGRKYCRSDRDWKRWNTRYSGKIAGQIWTDCRDGRGGRQYRTITLFHRVYQSHVLAWLWVTGAWPVAQIDHRDGDGINNRWRNLRQASNSQNARNRKRPINNTSGFKGVTVNTRSGKYIAQITIEGKRVCLGYERTPEAAADLYRAAAKKHYGEFARTN